MARAIVRYTPETPRWKEPQLITLTVPNVSAEALAGSIGDMLHDLVAIGRAIRRTDRLPLRALRKLECTCTPDRDGYHPHFHMVVEGLPTAQAMLRCWLELHSRVPQPPRTFAPATLTHSRSCSSVSPS